MSNSLHGHEQWSAQMEVRPEKHRRVGFSLPLPQLLYGLCASITAALLPALAVLGNRHMITTTTSNLNSEQTYCANGI